MLRITVHDKPGALTFQLEGRLGGPWVQVLLECWQSTLARQRTTDPPRGPDGSDLHRRRGQDLPGGPVRPGG